MINQSQRRMMSSSAVVDDLVSILNREIESEEEANNDVMPEELAEIKATIESDWRVVEQQEGNMTGKFFYKETGVGRTKISVELFCQEREDEDVGADDDEEDFSDELAAGVRFDAIVTKAGRALVFNCYSVGTEARVDGVKIKSVDGLDTKDDTDIYEGPILEELEEDLQRALQEFVVRECGLDDNFVAFLSMYADYREQVEYMNWLKNVRSFVQ